MSNIIPLGTKVGVFGEIAAVKKGELEYEYLLVDEQKTVTMFSQSDVEAMLRANKEGL